MPRKTATVTPEAAEAMQRAAEERAERGRIAEEKVRDALPYVYELRAWLKTPAIGMGDYLDDLHRLLDILDPDSAEAVSEPEGSVGDCSACGLPLYGALGSDARNAHVCAR